MLEYVGIAEQHYGIRFVPVSANEYRSLDGCPFCKDGGRGGDGDRFRLFTTGRSGPRVWCRQCGQVVFLNTLNGQRTMSDEEVAILKANIEKRREEERQKKADALALIGKSVDHIRYHEELKRHQAALDYWKGEGVNDKTIEKRLLGYCDSCPTAPHSASYTIPVLYHSKLFNIRHRLASPNGSGKYRPHMAGLPVMLYNADDLDAKSKFGLVLEGEKKSMVVSQETGFLNVGIMGMASFLPSWVEKFGNWEYVYIILDPDAEDRAENIARLFGGKGVVVTLPVKADDFFVRYGGTRNNFAKFMNMGRLVK